VDRIKHITCPLIPKVVQTGLELMPPPRLMNPAHFPAVKRFAATAFTLLMIALAAQITSWSLSDAQAGSEVITPAALIKEPQVRAVLLKNRCGQSTTYASRRA